MATKCLESWGDFSIFQDKELRHQVAESVATRLALSSGFVRERMDQFHRITNYEESRPSHSE